MANLTLTAEQIAASLEDKDGEFRLDSRIVCAGFGLGSHKDYRANTLEKYEEKFKELGGVFKSPQSTGEVVWYLTEDQVCFAGTLARNTEKAVQFKFDLVKAFRLAREKAEGQKQQPAPVALPSRELALETAVAIDKIQDLLGKSNPRLAQILVDCALNDVIDQRQLPAAAMEFPEDKWYGAVQIADKMGIFTNASTRVKLGQYLMQFDLERVREERLCNGQMQPIWCYRDDEATRAAIQSWSQQVG